MIRMVEQEIKSIRDDEYMVTSSSNGAILAYCSTRDEAEKVIKLLDILNDE